MSSLTAAPDVLSRKDNATRSMESGREALPFFRFQNDYSLMQPHQPLSLRDLGGCRPEKWRSNQYSLPCVISDALHWLGVPRTLTPMTPSSKASFTSKTMTLDRADTNNGRSLNCSESS